MSLRQKSCSRFCAIIFLNSLLLLAFALNSQANAEEFYRFDRMWPLLPQPWYFSTPVSTAADSQGCVYVVDQFNHRVQKFNSDGMFVTAWGHEGTAVGEFKYPCGIAIDNLDRVYIVDKDNHQIQKFTADGLFTAAWGGNGSGEGDFSNPYGVAVDELGRVHVSDSSNSRVQTFTDNGTFIRSWGEAASLAYPCGIASDLAGFLYVVDQDGSRVYKFTISGEAVPSAWDHPDPVSGQLNKPYGVFADGSGSVYVADTGNDRIAKFTDNGTFITAWGSSGQGDEELAKPRGIALSAKGQLYVADTVNDRIKKYTPQGVFITQWTSLGVGTGFFSSPIGVAAAADGSLFVADSDNNRIQKFTARGAYELEWGGQGSAEGRLSAPKGIALDGTGAYLFVVDMNNNRIQKFTTNGAFSEAWGSFGTGDGQFNRPYGIAIDNQGNMYIADTGNNRIQKFSDKFVFVKQWGGAGSGNGQFSSPYCVAADNKGFVYVADNLNDRVQKFTDSGEFVLSWGSTGESQGQFYAPTGIVCDSEGSVYVADTGNHRIQKFSNTGGFISSWGGFGSSPGQMSYPDTLALGSGDLIYVSDTKNNRIESFKKIERATNNKAIIVAGGGAYPGNTIWNETQSAANFAFRTLIYQGFTKDSIYYLSSDTDLDLDGNGIADEVDGDATLKNLSHAITGWPRGADNLVIYLVGPGGNNRFRMNRLQSLKADRLARLVSRAEFGIRGTVTIVYDACQSGSFLKGLKAPLLGKRIVVASTSAGESAQFLSQGTISFSNYFWIQVLNGLSVYEAYGFARDAIAYTAPGQHSLLDDTGDGRSNTRDGELAKKSYIGNASVTESGAPFIKNTTPNQNADPQGAAQFFADVTGLSGIARVWAVIRPPDFQPTDPDNPVKDLPTADLPPAGPSHYEGTYSGFTSPGTYQITICAIDGRLNSAVPQLLTVTATAGKSKKAVLVAGFSRSSAAATEAISKAAERAYQALRFQGYSDDEIYFLAQSSSSTVDVLATAANLEYAITQWASGSFREPVVCLIGQGDSSGFFVSETESVSAGSLSLWLDSLQQDIAMPLVFISDAGGAGGMAAALKPPAGKQRIFIASADAGQAASFIAAGDVSFSTYFWNRVANGATLRDAFRFAADAMKNVLPQQTAVLDDNGNGSGNEYEDGSLAELYRLGMGVLLAGDVPSVGGIVSPDDISGSKFASVLATNVVAASGIQKVSAAVTPPSGEPWVVDLKPLGFGSYFGLLKNLSAAGTYTVTVYAVDDRGGISIPVSATIVQTGR